MCQNNPSLLNPIQTIPEQEHWIQRCVQYKEELFSFGRNLEGQYYSPKDDEWSQLKYFKCNDIKKISIDEVLKKPYAFFVERAVSVYEQELPLIEDEKKFDSFMQETTKPMFIRGSRAELERLTKLAAFTLPELRPEFERHSMLTVFYQSQNDYHNGGVCNVAEKLKNMSKQAQQLFDLIFKYNYFIIRRCFLPIAKFSQNRYASYNSVPIGIIEVRVKFPLQYEKLEAALKLERWLKGKLPEEEIRAYFE